MAKQIEIPKTPEVEVQRQEVIAVMNDRISANGVGVPFLARVCQHVIIIQHLHPI
jgi:hypothetical protein